MATRMLIDARHPEETRVAVLKGNRIDEFDFESAEHKQIKGNIYLAKVTRVEPSLQAAFVDFGGNRHGFLAFSEIHPDYYQIPKEDREALLAEEAAAIAEEAALRAEEEDEEDALADGEGGDFDGSGVEEIDTSEKDDVATFEGGYAEDDEHEDGEDGDEDGGERPRRGRGRGRRQGKGGGYLLAKEPSQIEVGHIVRVFNGPLALVPCVSVTAFEKCEECLDFEHCGVRRIMKKVRDVTADILDGTTLEAMVNIEASETDEASLMYFI